MPNIDNTSNPTVDLTYARPGSLRPISLHPETITLIQQGGVPAYRQAISGSTLVEVLASTHHIPAPSTVVVTNQAGDIILCDTRIDPVTGRVTIVLKKPLTGYVLIH